jgi:hypothetical protein
VPLVSDPFEESALELPDGRGHCLLCRKSFKCYAIAKSHIVRVHDPPTYVECLMCFKVCTNKLAFASHLNQKHSLKGQNLTDKYGRILDRAEGDNSE